MDPRVPRHSSPRHSSPFEIPTRGKSWPEGGSNDANWGGTKCNPQKVRTLIRFMDPQGGYGEGELLWMDEILHHFETRGNHCLLVFTRGIIRNRGLLGAKWISIHSITISHLIGFLRSLVKGFLLASPPLRRSTIDPPRDPRVAATAGR